MKSEINVTPLIDVLLVILVIFMIVVPMAPTKLDASLPQPSPGTSPAPTALVLEVRSDSFALNTTPYMSRAALAERLRVACEERRTPTVFVKVAEGVVYDRVIEALDIAREVGASRIGLVDETAPGR